MTKALSITNRETVKEYFRRVYPEHCQRICEAVHEYGRSDYYLAGQSVGTELLCAFLWQYTPEGQEYWSMLARRELEA
jgi:hypothetical protein